MFQVPETAAACADLLYTTRQKRLEIQKQVDELANQETQIKEALIEALPKGEALGVSGRIARVSLITKEVPQVDDWESVYTYIKRHNAWDLMQRRLNNKAVAERWADKKAIPGVGKYIDITVSCVKV
jgi:hypothetical protein